LRHRHWWTVWPVLKPTLLRRAAAGSAPLLGQRLQSVRQAGLVFPTRRRPMVSQQQI